MPDVSKKDLQALRDYCDKQFAGLKKQIEAHDTAIAKADVAIKKNEATIEAVHVEL